MNNLACAVRDQGRAAEAIEILRAGDQGHAATTRCCGTRWAPWSPSRATMADRDRLLRRGAAARPRLRQGPLQPRQRAAGARRRRRRAAGLRSGAWSSPRAEDDRAMMRLARSTIKIVLGRIGEGWDDYEARLDPQFANATMFVVDERPRWTPDTDARGQDAAGDGRAGPRRRGAVRQHAARRAGGAGAGRQAGAGGRRPTGPALPALVPSRRGRAALHLPPARPQLSRRAGGRRLRARSTSGSPMASLLRRFRRRLEDFPDRARLPDPRPGPRRALARSARGRACRPQGRHPLEEHEAGVRPAALLFAVRALDAGAEDAGRQLRQPAVRRLRGRDRMGARASSASTSGPRPAST